MATMAMGLVGRKCGMTRVFNEAGMSIPVTVIEIEPNTVTQIKTEAVDGYDAIQVTTGTCKASRVSKGLAGHYTKAEVKGGRGLWEFRINGKSSHEFSLGKAIPIDVFKVGQLVDVTGTNRGKGFAGVIKRHHFAAQDATHGNSLSHRAPGSIGQRQTPGRVFKGKKMAGHLGNKRCTIQSLEIVQIDSERNLLLIKGAVPGAPGGDVIVKPAVKASGAGKEKDNAN